MGKKTLPQQFRLTSSRFFFCRSQVLNCFSAAGALSPSLLAASVSSCLISLLSPVESSGCRLWGGKAYWVNRSKEEINNYWLAGFIVLFGDGCGYILAREGSECFPWALSQLFFFWFCFYVYAPHFYGSAFCWSCRLEVFFLPFKIHLILFDFTGSLNPIWGWSGDGTKGPASTCPAIIDSCSYCFHASIMLFFLVFVLQQWELEPLWIIQLVMENSQCTVWAAAWVVL